MNHVAAQEVLRIHDFVLLRYGGCPGCPHPERVSALISRVRNYEFYAGLSDVFALAATYWTAISRGHVFSDGNKRTAAAVCFLFLRRNGVVPCNRPELEEVAVNAASGRLTTEELAEYFKAAFAAH